MRGINTETSRDEGESIPNISVTISMIVTDTSQATVLVDWKYRHLSTKC
jgi:hypothetical protein